MFRKVGIPVSCESVVTSLLKFRQILGGVLNMSHYVCSTCSTPHELFGSAASFDSAAKTLGMDVLARIPLEPEASRRADQGWPVAADGGDKREKQSSARHSFLQLGQEVWARIA